MESHQEVEEVSQKERWSSQEEEKIPQEWKKAGVSPPFDGPSPLKESPPPGPHLAPEVKEGQGGEEERQGCRAAPFHPPCQPLA